MLPEISHRCPSCGASVRDQDALFCPECGKPLAAKPKAGETADPQDVSPKPGDAVNSKSAGDPPAQPESDGPTPGVIEASAAPIEEKEEEAGQPVHRRGDKTRERLHRASEVARGVTRGVIEEPAKRVEKIRQASTVVIEEASYDPSLRFVLVALGLFVVFIILLVLSKVMG